MLKGKTVLVVEEEFLIALDLQRMLEAQHAGPALFARTAQEAFDLQERWRELGLAIVELRPGDERPADLAIRLRASSIPVVICSSDSSHRRGVATLPGVPVVLKPFMEIELASAIDRALASSAQNE